METDTVVKVCYGVAYLEFGVSDLLTRIIFLKKFSISHPENARKEREAKKEEFIYETTNVREREKNREIIGVKFYLV